MGSVVKRVRLIIVTVIAIFGLLVSFLDTIGILNTILRADSPFQTFVTNLNLIILSLVAIELIWERFETLSKVDNFLVRLKNSDTKLAEIEDTMSRMKRLIDNLDNNNYVNKLEQVYAAFIGFERRFSQVNAFFNIMIRNEKFQYLTFKYGLRQLNKILDEETVRVNNYRETVDIWRDCILESRNWHALSYAKNAWGTGNSFGDGISYDYQRIRIETGGHIQRVFILDSEEEYKKLESTMATQAKIKVDVKWILKEKLESVTDVQRCIAEIGTWDFALVDNNEWLYMFTLDKEGKISGCVLTMRKELVEQARSVYQEAWALGQELKPIQ